MKKVFLGAMAMAVLLSSCVSQKKYADLEAKHKETQDLLNSATVKLNDCLEEKATASSRLKTLEDQNAFLKANNQELINNMGNLTTLTTKGAENLEKSLESLKEKDLTIRKLNDAITRRDSVNLSLVQSLKGVLGNLDDEDIEISVEKGVVFVSISDKLLFSSGSYNITSRAKEVLGKVEWVFYSTSLGRGFRAVSDNQDIAQLMGLNKAHVFGLAMALALAVTAIAGILLGVRTSFDPSIGGGRLIFGFEAVIIGGLG
ncbi:MAG: branched-chain amino acid ABC transporter permease, partial [Bacteroidota bacterium]